MKESGASQGQSASELISKRIAELGTGVGKPSAECAGSSRKPTGRRRDGSGWHSDLVARRHHLHWRILQECREAYFSKGGL